MKKRLFAGLLALCLTVNLMSATAFAEGTDAPETPVCAETEACVDGVHGEDCPLFKKAEETPVDCDKTAECKAENHEADCEYAMAKAEAARLAEEEAAKAAKCAELCGEAPEVHVEGCAFYAAPEEEPVPELACLNSVECEEDVHYETCYWYDFDPEIPCDKTEGCVMPKKHLGECEVAVVGYTETQAGTLPNATVTNLGSMVLKKDTYSTYPSGATNIDRPLDIVVKFSASDEDKVAAKTPFDEWICDFYITIGGLEKAIVADDSYLAGHYDGTWYSGWLVIPMDGTEITNGEYSVVTNYDATLKYKDIRLDVGDFTAAIRIAPEIFEENPDMTITLELKMTNPEDGEMYRVGEAYTYEAADFVKFVAQDTNGKRYASLDSAFANGGTIKLISDVTTDVAKVPAGKTVTLDLNGHKITTNLKSEGRHHYAIDNYGTLTFVGTGLIEARGVENSGTMTFAEGSNVTITSVDSNGGSAIWNEGGTLTINAGTFTTVKTEDSEAAGNEDGYDPAALTNAGGTVTINGGAFNGKSDRCYAVIHTSGTTTFNAGASVEGRHGAIAVSGGTVTINGGSYVCSSVPGQSDHTLYASAGTLNVNAGVFKHLSDGTNKNTGDLLICENGGKINVVTAGKHKVEVDNPSAAAGAVYKSLDLHAVTKVAAVEESCTADGNKEHYKCTTCNKLFSDANATTEVTTADVTIAAKGHSYGSYKSDADNHWKECSCGSRTATGAHKYKVGGVCTTCSYKKTVEEDKTETKPSSSSSSSTTTTTTPETTTQTTTTQTTTTTKTETTTTPSEEAAIPVEEVKVDTKIVEEKATEEVKAAVKETVTVAEVKEVEKTTEDGTVTVTEVKVAVTTETIDKVIENTEAGATVILPLTEAAEEGQKVTEAEVAVEALEKIAEAESALTVEFEGVKVTFEAETIKAIAEQAQGSVIELRVVPVEHHELNEDQQAVLEAHDVAVRVSAQIFSDGEYIGDFKGGKATIAIPFTPAEGRAAEDHKVYFVADDGEMTLMPAVYVDGHMVFETTHFSDYVIVYDEVASAEEGPADIEEDMAVEEAPVEEVQEAKAGLPIIPIVIIVVVIIAVVAFFATRKKNDEE